MRGPRSYLVAISLLAALLAIACARRVPPQPAAAALYRDLERLVTLKEATGWYADRIEIEGLLSPALESACQVTSATRGALLAWLDREIAAAGGPVDRAYRARGRRLSEVDHLLTLTRIRLALAEAHRRAGADCPFWVEPSDAFAGRQISDDRWTLTAGGGGKLILAHHDGDTDLRFGGAGRLLVGRTFGSRAALYTGVDLGGSGSFPRTEDGDRGALVLGLDAVVPLVYRHTLVSSFFELEGGWLGTITEEEGSELEHGVHLGAAFGARAARTRWIFPVGAIGLSWERTFPRAAAAPLTTIKVGFRASFDLDL
ncbi:MAG TPA: hypothetical protein VKZ63_06765 [Kofleriaceae bacterium]|nr:hypothetical protein [Kofleriaceae bacterium]